LLPSGSRSLLQRSAHLLQRRSDLLCSRRLRHWLCHGLRRCGWCCEWRRRWCDQRSSSADRKRSEASHVI
jgi:hypothetical protein